MDKRKSAYTIPATEEHCYLMAGKLRKADVDEIWAVAPMKPIEALLYSVQDSKEAISVMMPDSEIPVCMFGLGRPMNILDKRRSVWLLGTDEVRHVRRSFIEDAGRYLETIAAGETVYNYVMKDNIASLHWLKILGFSIMEAKPFGWLQKPFHYVQKDFPKCVLSHSQQ